MNNDPDQPGYRRPLMPDEIYEPDPNSYWRLPVFPEGIGAWVGYNTKVESYWFHLWRFDVDHLAPSQLRVGDVFFEGGPVPYLDYLTSPETVDPEALRRGVPDPAKRIEERFEGRIPSMNELLDLTWNIIDWERAPLRVLARLRDALLFQRGSELMSLTGRTPRIEQIMDFIADTYWEAEPPPGHLEEGASQHGDGHRDYLYGAGEHGRP